MADYAVITDNGGGKTSDWHDVAGEEYYFPKNYLNILQTDTLVVYHRVKKIANSPSIPDRMSDESHYFGVARIGKITTTTNGNYCAEILDYKKFKYPVPIQRTGGGYYEINPFFQQGVRKTVKTVYDDIVAASLVPPVPVAPKVVKRKGIKSLATLSVVRRSNPFESGKYEVVTSSAGYYIYNIVDSLYYKLEKPSPFVSSLPNLRVNKSPKGSYLLMHDGSPIGFIDIIPTGILYTSLVSHGLAPITVNM